MFAAEILFRRLDGHLTEEELNVIELASSKMTEARTRSLRSCRASLSIPAAAAACLTISQSTFGVMPSPQILPDLVMALKNRPSLIPLASVQRSSASLAQHGIGPVRVCPVPCHAIGNYPVLLPKLDRASRECEEFTAPQSATNQKSEDRVVPFAPKIITLGRQPQRPTQIGREPITESHTDLAYSLDPSNAAASSGLCNIGISCLVCHTPNRGQTEVDRRWGNAIVPGGFCIEGQRCEEGKSLFRAVPINQLINDVIVRALAAFRCQAV